MEESERECWSFIPNIDDGLAVYILSTPDKKYVVEQVDPEGTTKRRIEGLSLSEALITVALFLKDDLEYI